MFKIHMGVPEMKEFWDTLTTKVSKGTAKQNEVKLHKLIGKALFQISNNPRYPGLKTHEITALSKRYGEKIWCSYLQNNTPAAGRIYWTYGPNKADITIVAIEPHPNDKSNSYQKITLSATGEQMG